MKHYLKTFNRSGSWVILWYPILFSLFTCNVENTAIFPRGKPLPSGTSLVPLIAKIPMEGIYEVVQGKERFGETVVLRWRLRKLTIFAKDNYLILHSRPIMVSLLFNHMEGVIQVPI